ncbi:hypothetical protein KM043_003258 [Ampulex compressa]|nr:hypothetical protein KM043_003258 [Ampulex compressa]
MPGAHHALACANHLANELEREAEIASRGGLSRSNLADDESVEKGARSGSRARDCSRICTAAPRPGEFPREISLAAGRNPRGKLALRIHGRAFSGDLPGLSGKGRAAVGRAHPEEVPGARDPKRRYAEAAGRCEKGAFPLIIRREESEKCRKVREGSERIDKLISSRESAHPDAGQRPLERVAAPPASARTLPSTRHAYSNTANSVLVR